MMMKKNKNNFLKKIKKYLLKTAFHNLKVKDKVASINGSRKKKLLLSNFQMKFLVQDQQLQL